MAYPLIGVILTIVSIIVLWPYLAWFVLVGMLVLFIIVPVQSYLGKVFCEIRLKAAYKTDERMKQMNEFIPAIRVIKMYAFENEFAKKISQARKNEINSIRNCLYLFSCNMAMFYTGAKVVIYATLVSYVLFSETGKINSELVYVTFATLNKLSFVCLLYFPHFFLSWVNGLIAIERINKFLLLEELDGTDLDVKEKLLYDKASVVVKGLYSTYAAKTVATMNSEPKKKSKSKVNGKDNRGFVMEEKSQNNEDGSQNGVYAIKDLSFEVKPGEILTIIGTVGR